jgi:hypothetical protein
MTKLLEVSAIAAERLFAVGRGPRQFHSAKTMKAIIRIVWLALA